MATSTAGSSAAKSGTGKSGSGRKKKVASQAGVARYHKPIGSEIGGARDANHAAIQQDEGARKNYTGLVSGDQAAQRKQLDAMNTEDLNKLADIAFSFRSSNPQVVALRIQARNAQARRGIHVKVGQTQTHPSSAAPAKAAPKIGRAKMMANEVGPNSARLIELNRVMTQEGTTKGLGNFPITDLKSLRNAISAIGRAKPEERPKVARHIITMARTLKAGHLVSDKIRHYAAGHSAPVQLAGHWKHGYIPLDAEATASKMKGGKGKPWWSGPGHSGDSAKKALHGSPKSGSPQRTEGATVNHSKMTEAEIHKAYLAAPKGSPEKAAHAAALKQKFDARAKKDIANGKDRLAKLGIDARGNKVAPAAKMNAVTGQVKKQSGAKITNAKGETIGHNLQGAEKAAATRKRNTARGAFAPKKTTAKDKAAVDAGRQNNLGDWEMGPDGKPRRKTKK